MSRMLAAAVLGGATLGVVFVVFCLVRLCTIAPPFVVFLVVLALWFDFENGANDAANSVATVVSTRVLDPAQAVAWAAFFNFVAAFGFGVHVARTVGKGIVDPAVVTEQVIFAALVGGIVATRLATRLGLPISCSHAVIGAFAGSACAAAGPSALVPGGLRNVCTFIVLSPVIGMILSSVLGVAMTWACRRSTPHRVSRVFRALQLASAAAYSIGHGSNDAQKTMGIICVLLFSTIWKGQAFDDVPFWIVLVCHVAMGLGTLAGGWNVVRTTGMRLTRLTPFGGFCAEAASALTLFGTATIGIPVSTTHTIVGAIVGIGSLQRPSAVRWAVARHVVVAWVLTIPFSFAVAAVCYVLTSLVAPA